MNHRPLAASITNGALAQLVARMHGMHEVAGSNPAGSTRQRSRAQTGRPQGDVAQQQGRRTVTKCESTAMIMGM